MTLLGCRNPAGEAWCVRLDAYKPREYRTKKASVSYNKSTVNDIEYGAHQSEVQLLRTGVLSLTSLPEKLCVLSLALQTGSQAVSARDTSQGTSVSIFTYRLSLKSQNLTFALSLGKDESGAFHLSGPSSYSWIAVGTGSRMEGSTMFITYGDGSQNGSIDFILWSTSQTQLTSFRYCP